MSMIEDEVSFEETMKSSTYTRSDIYIKISWEIIHKTNQRIANRSALLRFGLIKLKARVVPSRPAEAADAVPSRVRRGDSLGEYPGICASRG